MADSVKKCIEKFSTFMELLTHIVNNPNEGQNYDKKFEEKVNRHLIVHLKKEANLL